MTRIAMRPVTVISPGEPMVQLAGQFHWPVGAPSRVPGIVLCHPQPLVADMDDPLLLRLAQELPEAGFAVLRFNFRGVAPSQGTATDGRLEPLDVAGAVHWLRQQAEVDDERVALVGHAFGAIPALALAAADPQVGAVVAVSPPHFRLTAEQISPAAQARLILIGADDEVSPRHKIEPWLWRWPTPPTLAVVPRAQHLMRGREAAAAEIIRSFLLRWAGSSGAS